MWKPTFSLSNHLDNIRSRWNLIPSFLHDGKAIICKLTCVWVCVSLKYVRALHFVWITSYPFCKLLYRNGVGPIDIHEMENLLNLFWGCDGSGGACVCVWVFVIVVWHTSKTQWKWWDANYRICSWSTPVRGQWGVSGWIPWRVLIEIPCLANPVFNSSALKRSSPSASISLIDS